MKRWRLLVVMVVGALTILVTGATVQVNPPTIEWWEWNLAEEFTIVKITDNGAGYELRISTGFVDSFQPDNCEMSTDGDDLVFDCPLTLNGRTFRGRPTSGEEKFTVIVTTVHGEMVEAVLPGERLFLPSLP